jgi:transposase
LKKWPAVFNVLDRNDIEPTNSVAERGLRGSVIWRRTTQGTRTPEGSVYASRMLSVTETGQKQGRDILLWRGGRRVGLLRRCVTGR